MSTFKINNNRMIFYRSKVEHKISDLLHTLEGKMTLQSSFVLQHKQIFLPVRSSNEGISSSNGSVQLSTNSKINYIIKVCELILNF